MMLKKILIGLFLLFFVSSVGASALIDTRLNSNISVVRVMNFGEIQCSTLTYQEKPLSQVAFEIPSDVSAVLNGEIINLEITAANSQKKTVSGKVNNNLLSDLSCNSRSDATLTAYVTSDVMAKIGNSSNPIQAYKNAKASGEISFKPIGFVAGVKLFFADLFLMFQN